MIDELFSAELMVGLEFDQDGCASRYDVELDTSHCYDQLLLFMTCYDLTQKSVVLQKEFKEKNVSKDRNGSVYSLMTPG